MLTFLFKLIVSPLLIAAVSLAGRRWGPAVSGWLIGLPLTSAPVLFFLTLEHGPQSAVMAAEGIILGGVAVAAFCLAFARVVAHLPGWGALALSLLTYLMVAWVVHAIVLPPLVDSAVLFPVVTVALWGFPTLHAGSPAAPPPRWDLPVRMSLAAGIVVTLTAVVPLLGPHLVGILSAFPAFVIILGTLALRQQGPHAAAAVMHGVLFGLYGFGTFFLIVGLTIGTWGTGLAFLLAVLGTLSVQFVTLASTQRSTINTESAEQHQQW